MWKTLVSVWQWPVDDWYILGLKTSHKKGGNKYRIPFMKSLRRIFYAGMKRNMDSRVKRMDTWIHVHTRSERFPLSDLSRAATRACFSTMSSFEGANRLNTYRIPFPQRFTIIGSTLAADAAMQMSWNQEGANSQKKNKNFGTTTSN